MTNRKDLQWEDVPRNWALCFNKNCNVCKTCLRYAAGSVAPNEVTVSQCVMPLAAQQNVCPHFASMQKLLFARGFSKIFEKVLKKDFTPLRLSLTSFLGGKRYYYEYKRGERRLLPAQQKHIRQLFVNHGYVDTEYFDQYEEGYCFPWTEQKAILKSTEDYQREP